MMGDRFGTQRMMEPMISRRKQVATDLSDELRRHTANASPSSVVVELPNDDDNRKQRQWASIARLFCFTLPTFLFIGLRLSLYVIVLIPLFVRFVYYYAVASRRRVVRYGHDSIRQTLDVFDPPTPTSETTPIVFFVCGGAWIIGYKMWGALMARVLTQAGMTVVLPDYRNYPWGVVSDSIEDVRTALEWTKGLNRPIVAVGQSAGSHLLITLFLRQLLYVQARNTMEEEEEEEQGTNHDGQTAAERERTFLDNIRGLVVLSGPLDLEAMRTSFRKFGMDEGFVDRIFGFNIEQYDAMLLLDHLNPASIQTLPPIRIYHGTTDTTVPVQVAQDFCAKFQQLSTIDQVKYYDGWSHTDPILEGPADADHRFHKDVFDAVCEWTGQQLHWPDDADPVLQRLSLHSLVQLARFFMPF